jgi:hypothetical protein
VGELHEEEELRECARLARQAGGDPLLRDAEHLREQPALHVGVEAVLGRPVGPRFAVSAKLLLEGELRQQERHFVQTMVPQVVQRVDTPLTHDRRVLGLRREGIGRES